MRTIPVAGDRVGWLRSFTGRSFLQSTYKRSQHSAAPLHDIEAVWPLEFTFDMEPDTDHSLDPMRVVAPRHVRTSLLGLVPLPTSLVTVKLTMAMHDDEQGWDLEADVSALSGVLRLIRYEGPMRSLTAPAELPPRYVTGFHHLILYDGVCNLCNASVDFVIRNDAAGRFIFVAQQSEAAREALQCAGHVMPASGTAGDAPSGQPADDHGDSVLLLTPDRQLHDRSAAAMRVGLALDWPWPLFAALGMVVPPPLRDMAYNFVGRNRYRWFGKKDTCRIPSVTERQRFLG